VCFKMVAGFMMLRVHNSFDHKIPFFLLFSSIFTIFRGGLASGRNLPFVDGRYLPNFFSSCAAAKTRLIAVFLSGWFLTCPVARRS
jgi:hypothetical protein